MSINSIKDEVYPYNDLLYLCEKKMTLLLTEMWMNFTHEYNVGKKEIHFV